MGNRAEKERNYHMKNITVDDMTEGQKRAYAMMLSGENVFLTGEAGAGKSAVVKAFIEEAEKHGKQLLITAPTGTAAENLQGETIHRTFGANIGVQKNSRKLTERKGILRIADTVIIDEVSMCRFDLFEYVARRIIFENEWRAKDRRNLEMSKYSGYLPEEYEEYPVKEKDLQLIVLGDFYQLPPVIEKKEKDELSMAYDFDYGEGYAFVSKYWKMLDFKAISLTEVMRQEDKEFKAILSEIRHGDRRKKQECIDFLMYKSSDIPMTGRDSIYLIPTNKGCKEVNDREIGKLNTPEKIYHSDSIGEIRITDKFADDEIVLKEGCKVMTTVNSPDGDYVNGTMGVVKRMMDASVEIITENEKLITVKKTKREITKPVESVRTVKKLVDEPVLDTDGNPKTDEKGMVIFQSVLKDVEERVISHEKVGQFTQIPIKIAYAITVHKSQGKTFNKINFDPYAWDNGQFYTALSRAKKIENVCFLRHIEPEWIKTSPDVKKFMKWIEKASKGILEV